MKNIPSVGNNLPVSANLLTAIEKVSSSAEKASISITEASVLSLPRTKSSFNEDQGLDATLNSFLSGLDKSEKTEVNATFSGLDPSRVADLLSGD